MFLSPHRITLRRGLSVYVTRFKNSLLNSLSKINSIFIPLVVVVNFVLLVVLILLVPGTCIQRK